MGKEIIRPAKPSMSKTENSNNTSNAKLLNKEIGASSSDNDDDDSDGNYE